MSFDNEQKLLAAVMIEPDYIDMLRNQGVRAELFESPVHRRLFEAAEKQYRVSGTVEVTELAGELASSVSDPGAVLMEIQCSEVSTAGIESWIKTFKEDAAKAALVRAAEGVIAFRQAGGGGGPVRREGCRTAGRLFSTPAPGRGAP